MNPDELENLLSKSLDYKLHIDSDDPDNPYIEIDNNDIDIFTMNDLNELLSAHRPKDPVEVLEEKCKKLEKTINIIIELLPEDIRTSVKIALELDEGEDEKD